MLYFFVQGEDVFPPLHSSCSTGVYLDPWDVQPLTTATETLPLSAIKSLY